MTAYPHRSTDADQCTTLLFRTWGAGQGSGLCLQLSVNLNLLKIKSVAKSSDALEASPPAGGSSGPELCLRSQPPLPLQARTSVRTPRETFYFNLHNRGDCKYLLGASREPRAQERSVGKGRMGPAGPGASWSPLDPAGPRGGVDCGVPGRCLGFAMPGNCSSCDQTPCSSGRIQRLL